MKKLFIVILVFLPLFCYAQKVKIYGDLSRLDSAKQYRIQVGSFKNSTNAENAFNSLKRAGLDPSYEDYLDLKRVVLAGIDIKYLPLLLDSIYNSGFREVWIREEKTSSNFSVVVIGSGAVTEINDLGDRKDLEIVQTIPSFNQSGSAANTYQSNAPLVFFFNDKIYLDSLENNIAVFANERAVDGIVTINEGANGYAVLTFTANDPLPEGGEISIIMRKGLRDAGGNEMREDLHLSYITEPGSKTNFSNNYGFESGTDGIIFTGDGAIGVAKGSLVPYEGDHYAAISTGERIVSSGMAIGSSSSQIQLGPIQEPFSFLGFHYDFISAEFNEFVGSEFDDNAMVTIYGPRGSHTEIITSVNRVGRNNSRFTGYPRMPDTGDSYAGHTGWLYYSIENIDVGSPAYIIFTVTDVSDDIYSSILAVDALELK